MKYVIEWKNRPDVTLEQAKHQLALFQKWTPAASNIQQFVTRLDGNGGYSIVESDNPLDIMRDTGKFAAYLEFAVHPVVDIMDAAPVFQENLDFFESIPA